MNDNNVDAMNAMLSKIFKIFSAGDDLSNGQGVKIRDPFTYFSYVLPGIPVSESTFDFEKFTSAKQVNAASDFSQTINSTPRPTGFWAGDGRQLSDAYLYLLQNAVVPEVPITPEEQKTLDNAYAVLYDTIRNVNPTTGDITIDQVPSRRLNEYNDKFSAYNDAVLTYNNKRIDFELKGDLDPAVAEDWANNGPIYESQVANAYNAYRAIAGTIEGAYSNINQITSRGPATYFQGLKNRLLLAQRKDGHGNTFFYTGYFPSGFTASNTWVKFTFGETDIHSVTTDDSTSWGGGVSGGWGLWSWGGGISHTDTNHFDSCDTKNLHVEVELAQIPVTRGWFDPTLFRLKNWRLAVKGEAASNGLPPPQTDGILPTYVTSIVLARKLKVTIDMTTEANKKYSSTTEGHGSVGWGPFSLRGNYTQTSSGSTHDYHSDDGSLSSDGMQIIAFVCSVVPMAPSPDTSVMGIYAEHMSLPLTADQFNATAVPGMFLRPAE